MDQNISKLANSVNLQERKQAVRLYLANANWPNNKDLAILFLEDPDKSIVSEVTEAIIAKCPERYLPELKLLAVSEDKEIRAKVLEYFCNSDIFKGLDLLLERLPLEEPALAVKIKSRIKYLLEKEQAFYISQLLVSSGSENDQVRKESIDLLVGLPNQVIREFFLYLQGISPSVREKVISSANKNAAWFIKSTKELLVSEQESNLRLQAINLLLNFKAEGLEAILLEELKQKDWSIKHFVIKTLAAMKSENAKPMLIEAMDDKDLSIQAILALDSYRQADIGVVFLRKLGKASDDEQLALLNGIKNIADKRYIEPLLVFAAHEVCKVNTKAVVLEVIDEICKKTNTPKPAKVSEIEELIKKIRTADIPDLGLKLALE